jgi:hypothetical protein
VGDTARLTSWSVDDDLAFLRARQAQGRAILDRELSASRKILDVLLEDDHRLHG